MSFTDHPATYRADSTVEAEANIVRAWGNLDANPQFNLVELIEGPLRRNLPFSLDIELYQKRRDGVPAYVTFVRGKDVAKLNVERRLWKLAELNFNMSRFVLGHEVGHLKMDRNDALGFSRIDSNRLYNLEPQAKAEPQANKFADFLLIPASRISEFVNYESVALFFNVPNDCAKRRFEYVSEQMRPRTRYAGEACSECYNFTLIRIGTYCKCDTCGHRSGPF